VRSTSPAQGLPNNARVRLRSGEFATNSAEHHDRALLDRTGNVGTGTADCYRKKDVIDVVRVAQVRPSFIRWEEVWDCGQGLEIKQALRQCLQPLAPQRSLGWVPPFGQQQTQLQFVEGDGGQEQAAGLHFVGPGATPGSALPECTLRNSETRLVSNRYIRRDLPSGPAPGGVAGEIEILHAGHGEQIGDRLQLKATHGRGGLGR